MLRRPRWLVDDVAMSLGWNESEVRRILTCLEAERLVTRSTVDARSYRAVEPALGLPSLVASKLKHGSRRSELPTVVAIESFVSAHERMVGLFGERETLDDADELAAATERVATKARTEVMFSLRSYIPGAFEFSRQLVEYLLRRGVRVRAVWAGEISRLPPVRQHVAWLRARDIRPRVAPAVPCRTVIVDGLVALVLDDAGNGRIERRPDVVRSLLSNTQQQWTSGCELHEADPVPSTELAQRRYELVLRMLADGMTDDAVARKLGVSVRTVRNDVASAMSALDAGSRFQAGARAAQLGLI